MSVFKTIGLRLLVATLLPVFLVTLALYPILTTHLEDRLDSAQLAAKALLDAEHNALVQGMNESLNQTLAIAELPSLHRFLAVAGETKSPYREKLFQHDRRQLDGLFDTLITHFGRYTRLMLFDSSGRTRLSAGLQRRPSPTSGHNEIDALRDTMILLPRSVYVSPPYVGSSATGSETTTTLVDIATPVFGDEGQRLGALVFTLDWRYLVSDLPHTVTMDGDAEVLLVDARGTSLLPTAQSQFSFGSSLDRQWPKAWGAMTSDPQGDVVIEDRILMFRSLDLRNDHYRGQAEQVVSQAGAHHGSWP